MFPYPSPATTASSAAGNMPRAAHLQTWRRGYMSSLKLASWPWRLTAGAIDYLPLLMLLNILSAAHAPALGWFFVVAAILANNVYMQGTTGQSLGKRLVGIRLVSAVDTGPTQFELVYPGVGRCFGRQLAHVVDTMVFYLGWLRPLWQRQHKTWADSIAKTVVLDRREAGVTISQRQPGQATTQSL